MQIFDKKGKRTALAAIFFASLATVVLFIGSDYSHPAKTRNLLDFNPCWDQAPVAEIPMLSLRAFVCDTNNGEAGYLTNADGIFIVMQDQTLAYQERYERLNYLRRLGFFDPDRSGTNPEKGVMKKDKNGVPYVEVRGQRASFPDEDYKPHWVGRDTKDGQAAWAKIQDAIKQAKGPPK